MSTTMRSLVRETPVRVTQPDPNTGVRRNDLVPQPVAYQSGPHYTGGLIAGPPGSPGHSGQDGRSIDAVFIDANNHLIVILSDGAEQNAGSVGSGGASSTDSGTAAVPIGGHRVIRASGGQLYPASSADTTQIGTIIGLSLAAAAAGTSLSYKVEGLVTEPSWNFAPGPVFLGPDGSLTQSLPATGFIQQIGVVQTPAQVSVQIQPPILIG